MPGISPINILGNLLFFGKSYKLPVDFQKPSGDPKGKQYTWERGARDIGADPGCGQRRVAPLDDLGHDARIP